MAPPGSRDRPREREVGTVLSIASNGQVTVRANGDRVPSEGSELRDVSGASIGRVTRVFGPVARPYLSVRPRGPLRAREASDLIGRTVRAG